ncbi:MAG: ABC transporter ATP-binding protein, partial [Methylobacteriaceae bacterium]|nr:ABC transporter ATP-binding protein [Methylobacteriaceae bacterium]
MSAGSPPEAAAVALAGLRIAFPAAGRATYVAVDRIDPSVRSGEFVAIVGP